MFDHFKMSQNNIFNWLTKQM